MGATGLPAIAAVQDFSFNSSARISVLHVGLEREPVIVVDDAAMMPNALVDFASTRSRFEPAAGLGSFYPGLLGTAPTLYIDAMVRCVLPLIARHFDTGPVRPARARGNFSLVTTASEMLEPDQRLPHVDAADRLQFATVHFLAAENKDGTGFFRHRKTGFETLDAERVPAYRACIDAELETLAEQGYPANDHALFERTGAVEARWNRLILYRASLFHSGLISALPEQAEDPRRGRLTGNLFLQCRPQGTE